MIVNFEEYKKTLSEKYFMAINEAVKHAWYWLYFINNSDDSIDALVSILPGIKTKIEPVVRMADIDPSIFDELGADVFYDVPPKSYAPIVCYHDWDFDWSNACDILLKTKDGVEHLHFYFEKYCICDQANQIPVLNRPGWVFYTENTQWLKKCAV